VVSSNIGRSSNTNIRAIRSNFSTTTTITSSSSSNIRISNNSSNSRSSIVAEVRIIRVVVTLAVESHRRSDIECTPAAVKFLIPVHKLPISDCLPSQRLSEQRLETRHKCHF
jgi:hypothetical protein